MEQTQLSTAPTDSAGQSAGQTAGRYAHIVGWGADLDRSRRPAYPMERTPPRLPHPVEPPSQQDTPVEVLHSTEREGITPIYGTPQPPKGISGMLRRVAFKYSENDLRHWFLLMFADRVHSGEGIVSDLARGHVPNLYAEMGGPAELRHNPAGAARKAALGVGLLVLCVALSRRRKHSRRRD